jgi:hypothetical protein
MPVTFVWGNVSSRRVCKLPARDHWISLPSRMKRIGVGLAVLFFFCVGFCSNHAHDHDVAASSEKVVMHTCIWCRARNLEKSKDLEQYMFKVPFYNQGPYYKDPYLHVHTYLSTMAHFTNLASKIGFFTSLLPATSLLSELYIHEFAFDS